MGIVYMFLIVGLFVLIISCIVWDDQDYLNSLGCAILGIISILLSIIIFIGIKKNKSSIETNMPIVTITTNCETLVSKDGSIRINIYTTHSNNVVKLEKE